MDKKEKAVFQHGRANFDKEYYQRFFSKYSKSEFKKYVNWADGWVRFLDRYLDIKKGKGKKLLEIGSSLGYFARIFKDRGFNVSGSDISPYILKKVRILQKDIKFLEIDIEKTSDIEKKFDFDYVVAFEVLEHLRNPGKALLNIRKLLKQNGILIFSTPFPSQRSLSDPTHINVHEPSWWLNIGIKSGYRQRRVVYATFVPFLYRISKYLSWGFPIKMDIPYVNSTAFYIFTK